MKAVNSWPRYASHAEDTHLRSAWWRERYKNKRTYSASHFVSTMVATLRKVEYFCSNVDGLKPRNCGLVVSRTQTTWRGVEFSAFRNSSKKLTRQKQAFRSRAFWTSPAWAPGGQKDLQPVFAKSDRKFTSQEVLVSGAVAADRSIGERTNEPSTG